MLANIQVLLDVESAISHQLDALYKCNCIKHIATIKRLNGNVLPPEISADGNPKYPILAGGLDFLGNNHWTLKMSARLLEVIQNPTVLG